MTPPRPRPLGDRPPVADVLSGATGLLVGVDFDGTLAPIQRDPGAPLATPENRRALRRLAAHPATVVAVVSGRALEDLRPRVGVEDVVYAGNHGLEIDRGGPTHVHPDAEALRGLVAEACRAVEDVAGPDAGVTVEDKHLTATIHYRQADEPTRQRVLDRVRSIVEDSGDELRSSPGKANLELRPAVGWDKGSALRELAEDAPDGWATLYLGDDETDEDAFRALTRLEAAVGIHVGTHERTDAGYRLAEQGLVAPFLNALAAEIHGEVTGSVNGSPRAPAREARGQTL